VRERVVGRRENDLLREFANFERQIRAAPDQSLLYAGNFFKPMWREIEEFKCTNLSYATKETLPEIL
jgi:hypothetical protein